jgi:hypothetical protein
VAGLLSEVRLKIMVRAFGKIQAEDATMPSCYLTVMRSTAILLVSCACGSCVSSSDDGKKSDSSTPSVEQLANEQQLQLDKDVEEIIAAVSKGKQPASRDENCVKGCKDQLRAHVETAREAYKVHKNLETLNAALEAARNKFDACLKTCD